MKPVHRHSNWLVSALCLFLSSSYCLAQSAPRWAEYPEMIIHDAKIVTVDDEFTIAEAATIRNGRFEYVGTNAAVLERAGPGTRKINLYGRPESGGLQSTAGAHRAHAAAGRDRTALATPSCPHQQRGPCR